MSLILFLLLFGFMRSIYGVNRCGSSKDACFGWKISKSKMNDIIHDNGVDIRFLLINDTEYIWTSYTYNLSNNNCNNNVNNDYINWYNSVYCPLNIIAIGIKINTSDKDWTCDAIYINNKTIDTFYDNNGIYDGLCMSVSQNELYKYYAINIITGTILSRNESFKLTLSPTKQQTSEPTSERTNIIEYNTQNNINISNNISSQIGLINGNKLSNKIDFKIYLIGVGVLILICTAICIIIVICCECRTEYKTRELQSPRDSNNSTKRGYKINSVTSRTHEFDDHHVLIERIPSNQRESIINTIPSTPISPKTIAITRVYNIEKERNEDTKTESSSVFITNGGDIDKDVHDKQMIYQINALKNITYYLDNNPSNNNNNDTSQSPSIINILPTIKHTIK